MDLSLVETMERALLATFPALELIIRDGLAVAASNGATGRANSAVVIGPLSDKPEQTIAWASLQLQNRGLVPLFRLTPLVPANLLAALARDDSYGPPYNHTDAMYRSLSSLDVDHRHRRTNAMLGSSVEIFGSTPAGWLSERDVAGTAEIDLLMGRVDGDVAWAVVRDPADGEGCIAVGRGVLSGGWLSIQSMFTDPGHRGRGLASEILAALHRWAQAKGATNAFLDVLAANESAASIYRRFGYETIYQYHYVGGTKAPASC